MLYLSIVLTAPADNRSGLRCLDPPLTHTHHLLSTCWMRPHYDLCIHEFCYLLYRLLQILIITTPPHSVVPHESSLDLKPRRFTHCPTPTATPTPPSLTLAVKCGLFVHPVCSWVPEHTASLCPDALSFHIYVKKSFLKQLRGQNGPTRNVPPPFRYIVLS